MNYLLVIPARMKSSRLPGKPLIELEGKSMLLRTYERCLKVVSPGKLMVATDHTEIEAHCKLHGMNVMMTSADCLTGTDRVAEVAEKTEAEVYINVQGDEPLMNPEDIQKTIEAAHQYPGEIINGFAPIHEEDYLSPHVPKVVVAPDGRLLYMSRSPIPGNKKQSFIKAYRQVCVYAFPKPALQLFTSRDTKTELEEIEDLELLRFLEMGVSIRMIPLSSDSIAVDTPEDVERVRGILRSKNEI